MTDTGAADRGAAVTSAPKMTSRQVAAVLWEHFCTSGNWAMVSEVSASTGRGDGAHRAYKERRIDALLVRRSRSIPSAPKPLADPFAGQVPDDGGLDRVAIEIKVSRADFFADVRNPAKQAPWRELADRHAYAVPRGLVRPDEVPADSGLIEVWLRDADHGSAGHARFQWTRRAPRVATARPLPLPIILDMFYRTGRLEAHAKGYSAVLGGLDEDGDAEALRMEVERLRHQVELAEKRIEREVELRTKWQKRYAAHGSPPCVTCRKPLRPIHGRRSRWETKTSGWEWDHTTAEDHAVCQAIRTAASMEMNEAPEDKYLWVPPPEPAKPDDPAVA